MKKLKIFFLTNLFTNLSDAFVPYINEEIKIELDTYSGLTNEKKETQKKKMSEYYENFNLVNNDTQIHIVNIKDFDIQTFKNYIFKIRNIEPKNQLLFIKNNNIIDYSYRLKVNKLNPKYLACKAANFAKDAKDYQSKTWSKKKNK